MVHQKWKQEEEQRKGKYWEKGSRARGEKEFQDKISHLTYTQM